MFLVINQQQTRPLIGAGGFRSGGAESIGRAGGFRSGGDGDDPNGDGYDCQENILYQNDLCSTSVRHPSKPTGARVRI